MINVSLATTIYQTNNSNRKVQARLKNKRGMQFHLVSGIQIFAAHREIFSARSTQLNYILKVEALSDFLKDGHTGGTSVSPEGHTKMK